MTHKEMTVTTLKIQLFKNPQTGNTAEMVIDGDGLCTQYLEVCTGGVVNAGQDHEGTYWATWIPADEVYPSAYVAEEACLDDALSGLEVELIPKDSDRWHSERTGF
jgi:hypothetical protein